MSVLIKQQGIESCQRSSALVDIVLSFLKPRHNFSSSASTQPQQHKFFLSGTLADEQHLNFWEASREFDSLQQPFRMLASGPTHMIGIPENQPASGPNTYMVWGFNENGQCGTGDKFAKRRPTFRDLPLLGSSIVSVSCGKTHTIMLLKNRKTLLVAGGNDYGQLAMPDSASLPHFTPVQLFPNDDPKLIDSITCASSHTFALTNNGQLYAFGNNLFSQLGVGDDMNRFAATRVRVLKNGYDNIESIRNEEAIAEDEEETAVQVAGGMGHSILLTKTGKVYTCGRGIEGQLGVDRKQIPYFQPVPSLEDMKFRSIASGLFHSVAVRQEDDALFLWGAGHAGFGAKRPGMHQPVQVTGLGSDIRIHRVICGAFHTVLWTNKGMLTFGLGTDGQLGNGERNMIASPQIVSVPGLESSVSSFQICAGWGFTSVSY